MNRHGSGLRTVSYQFNSASPGTSADPSTLRSRCQNPPSPPLGWPRRTATSWPSTASTSRRRRAPCSVCSGRTAPARPPPCASSPRCSSPTSGSARIAGFDVVEAGAAAARPHRARGPERRRRREPHRLREPRDGRAPLPPRQGPVADPRARAARALRARPGRRPRRQDLLRRHAPPARPRRRARRPPAGALPRRADDRARPAQPPRAVGHDRGPRRPRHDRAADHAVPRGGRPARRPHRGARPRAR